MSFRKKKKRSLPKALHERYWIFYMIILFLWYKIKFFAVRFHYPVWDEAVYIGMSKFFYSLGTSGYIETLRPVLLPIILGPFRFLADNYLFTYELIELLFAAGTLYMVYRIGTDVFHRRVGLLAAFIVVLTPTFFTYSSFILTGIPSTFFALLALWLIAIKQRYAWGGVFTGLSFLTRFPQALIAGAVGVVLLRRYIREKDWLSKKAAIADGARYALGVIATILPYFVFNFFYYQKDTSSWFHATFRPLIFASNLINSTYLWLYESQYSYFFTGMWEENVLLAFALIGLPLVVYMRYSKKRKTDGVADYILIAALFIMLGYFTQLPRKEYRYVLSFLPYVALFAAYALYSLVHALWQHKQLYKKCAGLVLIAFVVHTGYSLHLHNEDTIRFRGFNEPPIVTENYNFLRNNPVVGTVVTTDPLLAAYIDNKIIPAYYSMQDLEYALQTYDYSAVFMVPRAFPCQDTDMECKERKKKIMSQLLLDNHMILDYVHGDVRYHLFSKENYFNKLSKEELFLEYELTQNVKLSEHPLDEYPVVLIMEDYPSLNDEKDDIWHPEEFKAVTDILAQKGVSPSLAVIPTHLQMLETVAPDVLVDVRSHVTNGGELLQNGLSHTDELLGDKETQAQAILEGQEIIRNLTGYDTSAFVPPFYSATSDTIKALEDLNYVNYISNVGDTTSAGELMRFDQSFTLINNWAEKSFKPTIQIAQELHYIKSFHPYLMVSLYYYMYQNETYNSLIEFLDLLEDDSIMSVQELSEWTRFRDRVYFTMDANEITLTAAEVDNQQAEYLTLLLFGDGTYQIDSTITHLNIKNAIDEPIEACFNQKCNTLAPGEIKKVTV